MAKILARYAEEREKVINTGEIFFDYCNGEVLKAPNVSLPRRKLTRLHDSLEARVAELLRMKS